MGDVEQTKFRFQTLQKRLKEERLFIKNEKEQLNILNNKVDSLSQNLFCIDWKNRQHWNNVDRLITAKAKLADCGTTSRFIDSVKFEDSYGHLNYEDSKYGKLILDLKNNPKLVALILNYCDVKRVQTSARQITSLIISTLYGNCTLLKDELLVLQVLKELTRLQVLPCEDLISFICGKRSTENAFACLLVMFSEILFASKLYLTAALHGAVMQVIVDDKEFLDYEISKVLSRLTPKATVEKYGKPGMSSTNNKIKDHVKILQGKLIKLCRKFMKSLFSKIYCFPNSVRWAIIQLYNGMLSEMKLPHANAKAIIGYMLMSYFICPSIINPEPYGINADAYISEIARHNLCQVASIFRSLALLECGLKDDKLNDILEQLQQDGIISYVSELLNGSQVNCPENNDALSGDIVKTSLLITEHNLKTLINCLKLLQSYNIRELGEEGLNELLAALPNPPSEWKTKKKVMDNNATLQPSPNEEQYFSNPALFGLPSVVDIDSYGINELREDLDTSIQESEIVLIIQLDAEADARPGMLSEEKVLDLENNNSHTFVSMDERERKPSSLMMDVFQHDDASDAVDNTPASNRINLLSNQSTSSNISSNDDTIITPSTDIIQFENLPSTLPTAGLLVNTNDGNKSTSSNQVPVDTLLNFNDDDDADDETPPALPVKMRNRTSMLNTPSTTPSSTNPFASSSPLFELGSDACQTNIFDNNIKTHKNDTAFPNINIPRNDVGEKNFFHNNTAIGQDMLLCNTNTDSTKTIGSASLRHDSDQELNSILQGTTVSSPATDLLDQFSPFATSEVDPDPWGTALNSPKHTLTSTTCEKSFENDFKPTVPLARRGTPPAIVRYSLGTEVLPSAYSEYRDSVIEEHKEITNSTSGNLIPDENTKRFSGGNDWLVDKIANRISTAFKSRMKGSESPSMKRDSFNDRVYRNLTHSQVDLMSTNFEKEVGQIRSKSISSTGSEEHNADDVEAILSKYRNMKDTSSSNELIDVSMDNSPASFDDVKGIEEDVVFNDEFKFDDAKNKLRSVLSKSNMTMLSSNAKNFDDFLLTMLQAKLAESINLQDRFSIAQYHETIRSIKQLPKGSCEKLLEHLEKEYKERMTYISYLIQSKQGLLSTISHLDDMTEKLQRDRVICSKYFTTASVRSYLDHPNKKREIIMFAQKFVSNKMADEKCALLDEFLSNLHNQMLRDEMWMYCNEEENKQLQIATERAIISKIYKDAFFPNSYADSSNDKIFHEHIKYLSKVITLSHPALQIPKMYQKEAPWSSAQTELLMLNAYKTPADKLGCIHRSIITIMNLLSIASRQAAGADDFIPVLVYVVIQANPPNLLSTKQYVNTFYEARLNGEELYCWMQFCAAIEFIKTIRTTHNT